MLEETHRRLAKELAKALNLDANQSALLEEGSVYPDFQESFPHHIGKEFQIKDLLIKARTTFLRDDDECYFSLGMAFHLMQDKWTLRARTRDKHTKWEDLVNKEAILADDAIVNNIKNSPIPSKFKEAYIAFVDILKNRIESKEFWTQYVNQDGFNFSSLDRLDSLYSDIWEAATEKKSRKTRKNKTAGLGIAEQENEAGWGRRILVLAMCAWASYRAPQVIAFSNLIEKDQKFEENGKIIEVTRYTTPAIDLSIAFVLCREIGKRVLSKEFNWKE